MDQPLDSTALAKAPARLAIQRANHLSNALRFVQGSIHEINNDLGPLVGYLSIMEIGAEVEPKFIAAMQESVQRLQLHLGQMSAQLKTKYPKTVEPKPFVDMVTEVLDPLQTGGFFRRVNMALQCDPSIDRFGAPQIQVCPVRFRQVLTSLLSNAIDAMDERDKALPRPTRIQVHLRANPTHVQLEIQDFGEGMSSAQQAQAFEPFASSKFERGLSLGLGLGVSLELVREMGGVLEVLSEVGEGVRVLVTLERVGDGLP